jgi:hypothetical protein
MTAQRFLAALAILVLHSGIACAQSPAPTASSTPAAFELADVHPSAKTTTPYFTGGSLRGDR